MNQYNKVLECLLSISLEKDYILVVFSYALLFTSYMEKDLTKWKITKTLILFALPMILGNLVQQIYNIADTIIVWKYIWDTALAAVWAAFPVFFLLISILIWLSTGVSVIISQLFWAKDMKEVKKSSYTALITAAVVWLLMSLIWYFLCGPLLSLLQTPDSLFEWSKSYLQIIFLGSTMLFIYDMATFTFTALWDSKTPLMFNIISAIINIWLDLLFILKFQRWISWAAIATVISRWIAMAGSLWILIHRLRKLETEDLDRIFDWHLLKEMAKIAVPAMLNQSVVSIWMLAIQAVVNGFGDNVIAWFTASSKIDTLAMLPIINLSNALATFVAQNLWAWKVSRAKWWFKSALTISVWFSLFMAVIIYFRWTNIMQLFLENWASNEIVEFWKNYMMVVSFGYILMGFLFNSGAVLRASWAMKPFLLSTLISTWVRIAAAFLLANALWESVIWRCVIIWRGIWALIGMRAYLKWNWRKINIVAEIENGNFNS